jgi:hypothetical protein
MRGGRGTTLRAVNGAVYLLVAERSKANVCLRERKLQTIF